MLRKYRLPGGPPPPLQEYGASTSQTPVAPTSPRNVSVRHARKRSRENAHQIKATAPGKKYGTNPKCRPMKKYSTLCARRAGSSEGARTLSASESLVVMRSVFCAQTFRDDSNGNEP